MKPDAIQVAIDILRELGHEDVARWVEHPEAVRTLLSRLSPTFTSNEGRGDESCVGCGAGEYDAHQNAEVARLGVTPGTREHCPIAAAWRALGDPRGAADIERAHEEALREHRRRFPRTAADLTERLFAAGGIDVDLSAAMGPPVVQLGANWSPEFRAQPTIAHESCRHAVVIQRYVSHVVDGPRGLLGPTAEVVVESACRACGVVIGGNPRDWAQIHMHVATRSASDARGMEAVEDEARATHARFLAARSIGEMMAVASDIGIQRDP